MWRILSEIEKESIRAVASARSRGFQVGYSKRIVGYAAMNGVQSCYLIAYTRQLTMTVFSRLTTLYVSVRININ